MTFYFYDLETSGINPRAQRIMQFAGQRTDANFQPIGEPQNWLVTLTDEILPDPDAVLITGITPQKTLEEGYSEVEFLQLLHKEVLQPDTIIVGFNSIRFDDEFMRATLWRNFYDPYEWQWQDGRSRWDLLDVVRMVRALRPEGIEWPSDAKGVPTNRLELLTKANGLDHANAHDALSDVQATIALAQLLQQKQPHMFEYLLSMRDKKKVHELVDLEAKNPFVYTSGRFETEYQKTTVAYPLATGRNGNVVVYDLRYDPTDFLSLSEKELADKLFANWEQRKSDGFIKLPVKELPYNKAPAVAPLGVLTQNDGWAKISLDKEMVEKHLKILLSVPNFATKLANLFQRKGEYAQVDDPDFQLYDSFVSDKDKTKLRVVRAADQKGIADLEIAFADERLQALLPRYKARNFPKSLSGSDRQLWEEYRATRIMQGVPGQLSAEQYVRRLNQLASDNKTEQVQYLLEELRLYAESIMPSVEQ